MIGLFCFVLAVLASPLKSKLRLEAENAVLRHQLIVLKRRLRGRVRLTNHDRWFFIQLYRWFPSILKVLTIIWPETLVCWHRAGFRCYWRWKSRRRGGRPQIETELRALIRRMSMENPLWGAPRIEIEAIMAAPDCATWAGRRDQALFMVLLQHRSQGVRSDRPAGRRRSAGRLASRSSPWQREKTPKRPTLEGNGRDAPTVASPPARR